MGAIWEGNFVFCQGWIQKSFRDLGTGWRLQGFTTFSFPPAQLPKCCLSARGGFLGQQQLLLSCQSFLSNTRTNEGGEWRHCGEGRLEGPGQLSNASPSHRDIAGCSGSLCPAGTAQGGDRDSRAASNGSGIRRCPLSSPCAPVCEFQLL